MKKPAFKVEMTPKLHGKFSSMGRACAYSDVQFLSTFIAASMRKVGFTKTELRGLSITEMGK